MARSLFADLQHRFGPREEPLSRREAMKMAAVAAAMLLGGCATAVRNPYKPVGKRIIVVGAGLAGLACADELKRLGYDVNVFEARRRLGGRVMSLTDWVPNQVVEAGGEFLGPNQPTWAAYRERFGLEFVDATPDESLSRPVMIEGKRLDDRQARRLFEEMRTAYGHMGDEARKVSSDEPWKTPGAETLDMRSMADWLAGQAVSPLCRRAITADLEGLDGVPLNRQSYLGKLAQIKGGGLEKYWEQSWSQRCKGGAQQLAEKLAWAIGGQHIYLGSAVVSIQAAKTTMLISTADGKTYEADDVVLGVAPSVWKKIQIYPDLPAVLRVQMGSAVKYLMAEKNAFWRSEGLAPDAFTDGPIGRTCSPSDGRKAGQAALLAFSGGPAADAVRKFDPDTRDAAYLAELQPLFPQINQNFINSRFADWPADPWTMAGYSFPAPGDITTAGPILRKGLGMLHFAGEHACHKFAGSMEGALNSGVSLAKRLAIRDGVIEA